VETRLHAFIRKMSEVQRRLLLKELEAKFHDIKIDQRQHHRNPLAVPVEYVARDRAFSDFIQDISAGGMFIETRQLLSVGQKLSMSISLFCFKDPIKINGKIVRITPKGVGVKFIDG
jgi:hypothetical protein